MSLLMFWRGRSAAHRLWGVFCISVLFWGVGAYKVATASDPTNAIWWWRIAYVGVIFIPVLFTHFVHTFLGIKNKPLVIGAYIFGFTFSLLNLFTGLFIREVRFVFDQFYYISNPTTLYNLFFLFFVSFILYGHIALLTAYRKAQGIQKTQIKYFFIATAIGFGGGSFSYLPVYGIDIYPTLNLTVCLFAPIITYAILRYRLMDVRLVARRAFVYFIVSIFVYSVYSLLIVLYTRFFGSVFSPQALIAGFFVAPLFVALFFWFNAVVEKFANRHLFYSLYNYQKTIADLTRKLSYSNDLDQIINSIVDTIKQTMQLNRAGVLLISKEDKIVRFKIAKVIGFDEKNGISLVQDNFLTQHLKKTQTPLIRDELELSLKDIEDSRSKKNYVDLVEHMRKIEASLCLPLMSNKELIGIIVLGSKASNDAYTSGDLELLNTLSYQAGIAIQNARLYKETKEFSRTLQQKVDEQTKDLKAQAEHQKKLLEMRSEFLDIASHQLKTPVSVILGTLSLFKEGSMEKVTQAERDKFIDNIFRKAKKLGTIINDILRASEMDTDEFKLVVDNIKPTQIEPVLDEVYADLKPEADEKGLTLNFKKLRTKLPEIMADADFLEQAIFNLVDNALKYTAKGFVNVEVTQGSNALVLTVADSGIGIPADDQKKIFDKFNRAKNAVNMYTDGSGLGLFIVKKIIEAHGGTIGFVSEENKGTTFTVTLPMKTK